MATEEEMKLLVEAVKAGVLNPMGVQDGLNLQKSLLDQGKKVPILNILVKKGHLSRDAAQMLILEHKLNLSEESATFQPIKGYRLIKMLGKGGVARVFLAENIESGKQFALKLMHPLQNLNALFVERFVNEARLLKEFDFPYIVKGIDYGQSGNLYYLAMEVLEGESVQDMLDREEKLDEDTSLYIIVQVAKALEYCQQQGILHRDIKPDNIMITKEGVVKLCDLGFAKPIEAGDGEEDTTCGTPQYISPEQARGMSDVDIRADIYSLGATLFHMATGELPFSGDDSMEVMAKQILEDLSTSSQRGNISMHMQYFIEKMMAKEREIRYQSARELIEDIEEQIKGKKTLVFDPNLSPDQLASGDGLFQARIKKKKAEEAEEKGRKSKDRARRDRKGGTTPLIRPSKRRRR